MYILNNSTELKDLSPVFCLVLFRPFSKQVLNEFCDLLDLMYIIRLVKIRNNVYDSMQTSAIRKVKYLYV